MADIAFQLFVRVKNIEKKQIQKGMELKSINKNQLKPNPQARGDHAERIVCEYFQELGYQVCHHRKRIFGVEFDWIFKNKTHHIYVEVKSVHSPDFFLNRWPARQKQRFIRVASVLGEKQRAHFYLALVDHSNNIQLFKLGHDI